MVFSAVTVLALLVFLIHVYVFAETLWGLYRMEQLREIPAIVPGSPPRVSVIVPACNEEDTIGPALQTLLDQDYPNLEIIVIDDRSSDNTGAVVSRHCSTGQHNLHVLRIDRLPPDWLGKSHALQKGAEQASGEILLFTDADIRMEKTSISRAVSLMVKEHLDHLSLIFQPLGGSWLLNAMILDAASGLLAMFKPWKVDNPRSSSFMGVGAFNMIRSDCYTACGGHRAIRMHPVDDLMLGKLVKVNGFRQKCLLGHRMITVYWYRSVPEMVNGLMKNVFSVFHYRLWLAAAAIIFLFVAVLMPMAGMFVSSGYASLLFGASFLLRLTGFGVGAALSGMHPGSVFGAVATPFISIYIVGRAALETTREGGITWRGTFYPLKSLRKSPPLLF